LNIRICYIHIFEYLHVDNKLIYSMIQKWKPEDDVQFKIP
jgi:hypothetical protein